MRAQINDSLGYNILTSLIPILASNETMQKAIVIFLFYFWTVDLGKNNCIIYKPWLSRPTDIIDNDIIDSLKN